MSLDTILLYLLLKKDFHIGKFISLNEIKGVFSNFSKDKSLGLDGWPLEIFIAFIDLISKDLLEVVDMSRTHAYVFGSPRCSSHA